MDPAVWSMDETLAAMGAKEDGIIVHLVNLLRQRGDVSLVIIAHDHGQVFDVCDRVNLLQHGEITLDEPTAETSAEELLDLVAREYHTGGTRAAGRGSALSQIRGAR